MPTSCIPYFCADYLPGAVPGGVSEADALQRVLETGKALVTHVHILTEVDIDVIGAAEDAVGRSHPSGTTSTGSRR